MRIGRLDERFYQFERWLKNVILEDLTNDSIMFYMYWRDFDYTLARAKKAYIEDIKKDIKTIVAFFNKIKENTIEALILKILLDPFKKKKPTTVELFVIYIKKNIKFIINFFNKKR